MTDLLSDWIDMGPRWIVLVAAVSGLVAVGMGAMGTHVVEKRLKQAEIDEAMVVKKMSRYEMGVRYQAYHALAILAVGLSPLPRRSALARAACGMFLTGTVFFCGGLYCLSMAMVEVHWSILPAGGLMLMMGWLLLAGSAFSIRRDELVNRHEV